MNAQNGIRQRCRSAAALLAACLLVGLFITKSFGQSYLIDWYRVAGGGGMSSGGAFSVTGTIGQHDAAGTMSGANYSVTGGFWSLFNVVSTAETPTLYIGSSSGTVIVFWQNIPGWTLQQTTDLSSSASWVSSSGVSTTNGTNYVSIIAPGADLFLRLKGP